MAHIAFITLYLGLVSGRQPIELKADPIVVALRMELDGKAVATLSAPPWLAIVDFGRGIEPQELVAIGFDAGGQEVGRASQAINLPRPLAEAEIVLQHDAGGLPVGAEVRWRHLTGEQPKRMALTLDNKPVLLKQAKGALPHLDLTIPHVLAADVNFSSGNARKEIVFGGTLPDSAGSELTATAVMETGTVPASLDGCFASGGRPVRVQALEKSEALVILVRDPDPSDSVIALFPPAARVASDQRVTKKTATFDADTRLRIIWPVAERVEAPDQPTSVLFPFSGDFGREQGGMLWALLYSHGEKGDTRKRQFADAVAVAGVKAMAGARRRAVVLALGNGPDGSRYDAPTVRRYLDSIGVPLFVWSLTGPRPELTKSWGEVVDVSSQAKLQTATDLLRKTIAAQRIAWLYADPLHALRATVKASCGLTMASKQ
jgi:hypothetical protein